MSDFGGYPFVSPLGRFCRVRTILTLGSETEAAAKECVASRFDERDAAGGAQKGPATGSNRARIMAIGDLPIFSMMKQRLHWLTERQQVLAENVANANTPGYEAKDLKELDFGAMVEASGPKLAPVATTPGQIGSPVAGAGFTLGQARGGEVMKSPDFETTPTGNSVVLEDEMVKVAQTQMDYETVTTLYSKSLGLVRMALGGQ